ncbi:MAG: hypothetical protein ACR2PI_21525 [Hyphomicrobiaceae bacterium]
MESGADFVLAAFTDAFDRLIDKADLTVRSWLRGRQDRRIEKLYGNLPAQPMAPRQGSQRQIRQMADLVLTHCSTGSEVVAAHGAAAVKIDATEYALSMMLEELRGVMSSPPTSWRPQRTPFAPTLVPVADTIARAA